MAAERSIKVILRAQIDDFKRQMDAAAHSASKVGKQSEDAAKSADTALGRMTQSATANRQEWETAGNALMGFGAIATAAVGASVAAAVQWESAWAGVTKTVDGSTEQMAALEAELRGMATTLPATHQEIAAVAEAAGQLGVAREDISSFTKTMIDLGETTNLTADEAATSIAQLMNVMQTAPEDVDNLGSTLVALGNAGASTERDIIQMAQRIAGAGAVIGLTEGEVLGLANALASAGIEVEAGGSAISNIMIDISKAVSAGGEDLDKWAQLAGMSAQDFATAWKGEPAEALVTTIEGLGALNDAGGDVFGTLSDLGQSDVRVTRALLSMATSGDMLRESLALQSVAWSENTALLVEAEKRYDTPAAKIQVLKNSINEAAISMGENLLPAVAGAADALAALAQAFSGLPGSAQTTLGVMGLLTGASALAGGAFLRFFPQIIETRNAFTKLSAAGNPVPGMLGRIGKAAGVAVGVVALSSAFIALADVLGDPKTALSVSKTTEALLGLGEVSLDDTFRKFGEGGKEIDGLAGAAERLLAGGAGNRVDQWGASWARSLGIQSNGLVAAEDQFKAMGESLALLVQSGDAEKAATLFGDWYSQVDSSKVSLEQFKTLVPAYGDSLSEMNVEQNAAAVGAEGLATSVAAVDPATEAATEAMAEWVKSVEGAGGTFGSLGTAYQGVIDKNTELATSTAEATKSSEDDWSDFYDGTSVSIDDWIAKLKEQREATENWAANYQTALGQVKDMPAEVQGVALAMIEEMTLAGEEGAPMLQQWVDAAPEQRQALLDEWNAQNLAEELVANTPVFEVEAELVADLESADRANAAWGARLTAAAAANPAKAAVDADVTPADASVTDWRALVARDFTDIPVDADVASARETVAGTTSWIDNQNPFIDASADDSTARSTVGGLVDFTNDQDASVKVTTEKASSWFDQVSSVLSSINSQTAYVRVATTGGPAPNLGGRLFATGKKDGGSIVGPGTGTSDSVLIAASNGEHMWTTAEVNAVGGHGAMYALRAAARAGQMRGYRTGGEIGGIAVRTSVPAAQGAPSVTLNTPVDAFMDAAREVAKETARQVVLASRGAGAAAYSASVSYADATIEGQAVMRR